MRCSVNQLNPLKILARVHRFPLWVLRSPVILRWMSGPTFKRIIFCFSNRSLFFRSYAIPLSIGTLNFQFCLAWSHGCTLTPIGAFGPNSFWFPLRVIGAQCFSRGLSAFEGLYSIWFNWHTGVMVAGNHCFVIVCISIFFAAAFKEKKIFIKCSIRLFWSYFETIVL